MIDFETKIFNAVHPHVAPLCAKNKFVSQYVGDTTAFPAASLVEMSNTTVREKQSNALTEDYARIMYQLDCYALTKSACRAVFKAADDAMIGLGFVRIMGNWIDNAGNTKVTRYTARYEAEIDPDGMIYRRG